LSCAGLIGASMARAGDDPIAGLPVKPGNDDVWSFTLTRQAT